MAITRTVVRAFLASPGDLVSERAAVRSAVDEINRTWAEYTGFQVEVVGWEDNVSQGGRAQQSINQILGPCDLFIGLLWRRWGTPPGGTYTSGFEEEFSIALSQFEAKQRPQISLYFKNVEATTVADPGPQLEAVLAFKEHITKRQSLYYEHFDDVAELQAKIRRQVSQFVQLQILSRDATLQEGVRSSLPSVELKKSDLVSPGETAFLSSFVKAVSEGKIDQLSVARTRLIVSRLAQQGNDDASIGVHDANMIYAHLPTFKLDHEEAIGLLYSGLENFFSETVPVWLWTRRISAVSEDLLGIITIFETPERRVRGSFGVMRFLKWSFSDASVRARCVETWLSERYPDTLKKAALKYFGEMGLSEDIPKIEKELSRRNTDTSGACVDAIIMIRLRENRIEAFHALVIMQPDSISSGVVDKLFTEAGGLPKSLVSDLLRHKSSTVRLQALHYAAANKMLDASVLAHMQADEDREIQLEALKLRVVAGENVKKGDAFAVLVKPRAPGFGLLGGSYDVVGYQYSEDFRESYYELLPNEKLASLAGKSVYDHSATILLAEQKFKDRGGWLREAVDDRFTAFFQSELAKLSLESGETIALAEKVQDELRKEWLRYGISVLARRREVADLPRMRDALADQAIKPTVHDFEYFQHCGEWADIVRVASAMGRTGYLNLLMNGKDDLKPRAAAVKAIAQIAKHRLSEFLSLELSASLFADVLEVVPHVCFAKLSDSRILELFSSQSDRLRKVSALACILSLGKKRIESVTRRYLAQDQRFYNVIFWLDLSAIKDATTMRRIARAAIGQSSSF